MNKIVFIIKPDYFNSNGISDFLSRISDKDLLVENSYLIRDFDEFSYTQRLHEILKTDNDDYEKKMKELSYTIEAYKFKYPQNLGLCVVLDNRYEENEEEFYKKASDIKKEIRKQYVKPRKECIYAIHCDDELCFVEDLFENFEILQKEYGEEHVNLTYLNYIHLEDYDAFTESSDYNLLKEMGILDEEIVDIFSLTDDDKILEVIENDYDDENYLQ